MTALFHETTSWDAEVRNDFGFVQVANDVLGRDCNAGIPPRHSPPQFTRLALPLGPISLVLPQNQFRAELGCQRRRTGRLADV